MLEQVGGPSWAPRLGWARLSWTMLGAGLVGELDRLGRGGIEDC